MARSASSSSSAHATSACSCGNREMLPGCVPCVSTWFLSASLVTGGWVLVGALCAFGLPTTSCVVSSCLSWFGPNPQRCLGARACTCRRLSAALLTIQSTRCFVCCRTAVECERGLLSSPRSAHVICSDVRVPDNSFPIIKFSLAQEPKAAAVFFQHTYSVLLYSNTAVHTHCIVFSAERRRIGWLPSLFPQCSDAVIRPSLPSPQRINCARNGGDTAAVRKVHRHSNSAVSQYCCSLV